MLFLYHHSLRTTVVFHVCTHIHTYTHTHIHTYTHTHIHTYTHTHIHTYTHTHIHTYTHQTQDLEKVLKETCQAFIETTTRTLVGPVLQFLTKVRKNAYITYIIIIIPIYIYMNKISNNNCVVCYTYLLKYVN